MASSSEDFRKYADTPIARRILEECHALLRLGVVDVVHWLRIQGAANDGPEAEAAIFELALFCFALLVHTTSALSPLPPDVLRLLLEETNEMFEHWVTQAAFSHHLGHPSTAVPHSIRRGLDEYNQQLVFLAVADANASAQIDLCNKLFANANVRPNESQAWHFRVGFICQSFARSTIRILDLIYTRCGANSSMRELYEDDVPSLRDDSSPSRAHGPSEQPSSDGIAAPLVEQISMSVSAAVTGSLLLACFLALLAREVVGLVSSLGNSSVADLGLLLLAIVLTVQLAIWARRLRSTGTGALNILQTGRYVLYLRSSDVDRCPPHFGFEAGIAAIASRVAPVLSVGPPRLSAPTGGVRISLASEWETKVARLIRAATLTILVISPRRGYDKEWGVVDDAWKELESIIHLTEPGRLLIMFPRYSGDYPVLLLHPKGDRIYGASTLLHEVRRLLCRGSTFRIPKRMGSAQWLWWKSAAEFVTLSAKRSWWPGWRRRNALELRPVFEAFGRVARHDWPTIILMLTGTALGLIFPESWVTAMHVHPDSMRVRAGLASAVLILTWFVARAIYRRSKWLAYDNTIRPTPADAFGLNGAPPGGHHDELPY